MGVTCPLERNPAQDCVRELGRGTGTRSGRYTNWLVCWSSCSMSSATLSRQSWMESGE